jgi:hypothetical protein
VNVDVLKTVKTASVDLNCKKCDCGKEKETKEDWNPNASVGTQPGGLMQGAHFPKWIQENKNNFKRLIK